MFKVGDRVEVIVLSLKGQHGFVEKIENKRYFVKLDMHPILYLFSPNELAHSSNYESLKCECGAASVGSNKHSYYCPLT